MNDFKPTPSDEFKPLAPLAPDTEIPRLWLKALLLYPEIDGDQLREQYLQALLNFYSKFSSAPWNKT